MSKKAAGKALKGETKQLFIDIVNLAVGTINSLTKPQLAELADKIRLLFRQYTATAIFEQLGRNTSLPEYQSNGTFYASVQNWMARWMEVGVMEAKILQYAKDSVEAEASPVANIGGFDAVAGGVPATPGAASLRDAPVVVPQQLFITPAQDRRSAAAELQTPSQMDPLLQQICSQFYQDMGASNRAHDQKLEASYHAHAQQLADSNAAYDQRLAASNAAYDQKLEAQGEQFQQQIMTLTAKTEEKFKEHDVRIDRLGGSVGELRDTVADLEKRYGNLEEQVKSKKRVSFYQSNHVKLKRKSILKDQSTPTQPSTRSTRSRSAQESTPVNKRTTRSMTRKNEK